MAPSPTSKELSPSKNILSTSMPRLVNDMMQVCPRLKPPKTYPWINTLPGQMVNGSPSTSTPCIVSSVVIPSIPISSVSLGKWESWLSYRMNRATDGPDLLKEVIQEMHVFLQPLNGNSSDKEYKQAFACENDAHQAWKQAMKGKPSWLTATFTLKEQGQYQQRGRPKKETTPDQTVWYLVPQLEVDQQEVWALARKKAAFIVATNILDVQRLSHEQVILTYKEQGGVERGFRFLKDPLFLASSVFVKKPERVIALSFVMVLCLLVYRLAEHLLRRQLVATKQTFPNQVNKPTSSPTMRWIFHCFEGIDLLHIRMGSHWHTQVLGLQALHRQVLRLLGPVYSQFYFFSP